MMAIRKMGPLANLLGMLPGAGAMKEQIKDIDDRDLDRTAAIIQSMTPTERITPKIINASRRVRIANGSGVSVTDVNQLLERFAGPEDDEPDGRQHGPAGHGADVEEGPRSARCRPRRRRARGARARPKSAPRGGPWGPRRSRPAGSPAVASRAAASRGGVPGLPPGQQLPDLSKLRFDAPGDERPGR